MAALIGHWELRKYGSYAIEDKANKNVMGVAGFDYPGDWPEPEIQWGLSRKYWGKGYASEAVRAVKKMTAEYLPTLPLISLIHSENSNSINLAKAVGAYFEKEFFFRAAASIFCAFLISIVFMQVHPVGFLEHSQKKAFGF